MSTGSSLQSAFDGLFRTSYRLVRILALVFAGLFTMGPINAANAGSVTLQWDPVDDPQVTSYEICYGLSSGQYGELCAAANDQGNATNKKTIDGLTAGKTYYFAARSANHTPGVYSTFSNEVSATVPAAPSTTIPVTPATGTIWPSTAVPGLVDGGADNPVELGVKFRSDVSGTITGIRFYKASANTGTHVGNLWSSTGSLLASVTFTNETASGWQQVNFASPVPITANTVYVASYHTNVGHYSADVNYFATTGVDNPPLHALANGVSGGNGVYAYGASSAFPTQTWNTANYWVDVVFAPGSAPKLQSIAVTPVNPEIPTGGTQQFTATGTYSDGSKQDLTRQVTWDSANKGVATINSSGLATGLSAGSVRISATLEGVLGSTALTVQAPYVQPPAASFTASPTSGTAPLTVTLTDTSTGEVTSRSWDLGEEDAAASASVVKTFTEPGTYQVVLTVMGGGTEATATKTISVAPTAPVAQFSAGPVTGTAPLQVQFTDASKGIVNSRSWKFGDGGTSIEKNPSHTYTTSGLYTVTLSVSGPGGDDTLTRSAYVRVEESDVAMEVGELQVNHEWQRIELSESFVDPIVVVQPPSASDAAPAVVRVDAVDPEGFSIRVQEWDYLDGYHADETVSYIVMERGSHQLPDGAWVEAGRLETNATKAFVPEGLSAPFAETPVVFAVVSSANEEDAVATRLRNITRTRFEVGMREQELNRQKHLPETIDYIAWEPSFGEVNGVRYEVGLMGTGVTDQTETLVYPSGFAQPPLFLADMQTTAGGDTANLRWSNRTEASVDVWVSEEQSKNDEVSHVAESVGYLLLEPETVPDEGQPEVCATPCSLWDDAATPKTLADPDTSPVELGIKFRSDADGLVTSILFYKSQQNTGTHKGSLWSSTGQLLAQATFTDETASGWQRVDFPTPVAIQADTVYIASYHTNAGRYSVDEGYCASAYSNGPLHLLADGESGGNGLYLYGAGGFPTESYRASNYWIDVLFVTP